jgi:hypothetical protein
MGPEGAVSSFHALGGHGLLMPIHWGLYDLALHHWKQSIENVFAVKALKLWSPERPRLRLFGFWRFAPSGGVEAMATRNQCLRIRRDKRASTTPSSKA